MGSLRRARVLHLVSIAVLLIVTAVCLRYWRSPQAVVWAAPPGASALDNYFAHKYPDWAKKLVSDGVNEVFAGASPADRQQAVLEALAYCHVVYHPTLWHHIENNLAVTHQFQEEIDLSCERFGVPKAMAYGILTWENSGSVAARSFAACVGMGQLSDGAVEMAHHVSAHFAKLSLAAEGFYRLLATVASSFFGESSVLVKALRARATFLAERAHEFNLAVVHAHLARMLGQPDERMIPRANIEDSIVYMRYLLEMYGGRADLAISAYHNGVSNTDDLLRDYLRRKDPAASHFTFFKRSVLFEALRRHQIDYITLWNDRRCRQMLNGLRTMDGDITNSANQKEAMGDESDIYLWKTLAALAGVHATPTQVAWLRTRYLPEQSEAETVGFSPGTDLIHTRGNLIVTRELLGYLDSLARRLRQRAGRGSPVPPIVISMVHDTFAHRCGMAVDISINCELLDRLLKEDWLYDRIYRKRLADGHVHICLNPRFGNEFLGYYEASQRSASASR